MRKEVKRVLLEAGILVMAALVVGLLANAMNRNGVTLTRHYYASAVLPNQPTTENPTTRPDNDNADLRQGPSEFQEIDTDQAAEWFNDPNPEMPYVWVDARKADMYEDGHIWGAHLLDHFRVQHYLDQVRPWLQIAGKIIAYCEGGDCDDSTLLATYLLNEVGVPYEKLYIYKDGLEVWRVRGLPIREGSQP